jgi:hypothetical protein
MPPIKHITAIAATGLLFAGCGKEEPTYYEVKEVQESPEAETMEATHSHAEAPPAEESSMGLAYSLPEGWSETAPGRMVMTAFQAGTPPEAVADVAISAFPGDVGGQLANVNRWRRQVGLGPVAEEALQGFITNLQVGGLDAWQVDLTGPEGQGPDGTTARVVVTAVAHGGQTWFVKMTGTDGAVEAQLPRYQAFVQSLHF